MIYNDEIFADLIWLREPHHQMQYILNYLDLFAACKIPIFYIQLLLIFFQNHYHFYTLFLLNYHTLLNLNPRINYQL